jgi:hypothetical protein
VGKCQQLLEAAAVAATLETGVKISGLLVGGAVWAVLKKERGLVGKCLKIMIGNDTITVEPMFMTRTGDFSSFYVSASAIPDIVGVPSNWNQLIGATGIKVWETDLAESMLDMYCPYSFDEYIEDICG